MSQYYDSNSDTYRPMPNAPFYVCSNDRFMSGWGPTAGRTNTCVVPCDTIEQAKRVADYAREKRTDQSHVRITTRKPRAKSHVVYSLVLEWRNQ